MDKYMSGGGVVDEKFFVLFWRWMGILVLGIWSSGNLMICYGVFGLFF